MIKKISLLAIALLVTAAVLLAAGCGSSDNVATVDGHDITKSDLDKMTKLVNSQSASSPAPQDSIVNILVVNEVLALEAPAMNITVSDDEVNSTIDKQKQTAGGDSQFQDALNKAGIDLDWYKNFVRNNLYFRKVLEQVTKNVTVSDQEVQDYYNQHASDPSFQAPETRQVRHILVADEKTANDVKAQLDAGADFAALASKYSIDPGSKDKGGLLYNPTTNQAEIPSKNSGMVPEFEAAMDKLQAGQTSGPVKTQYGYHIIRVDKITPPHQVTFAEVKDGLKQQLLLQKQRPVFDKWLSDAMARHKIEYADGYAPATTPVGGGASTSPAGGLATTAATTP